jgi:hypothetical protein
MNTTTTLKSGDQLWGIYYTDRELDTPLRTVVEAPTKLAAEETAANLGFSNPRVHPVTSEQAKQAQWLPNRRPAHWQTHAHKPSRRVHIRP